MKKETWKIDYGWWAMVGSIIFAAAIIFICIQLALPIHEKAQAASPPYSAAVMDRLIRIEALLKRLAEDRCQCFCEPEEGDQ
jgi:hypothetical protein